MLKTEIRNRINFPVEFVTQQDLLDICNKIIIPDIQKGIHAGRAIDGGSLPSNDPQTIKRKGDNRPLIDSGTLLGSFIALLKGKSKAVVTIGSERKDIAGYLQIEGIKTKLGVKFYKFFGISADSQDFVVSYMEKRIKKAIDNA
jgi:hypothetical protein